MTHHHLLALMLTTVALCSSVVAAEEDLEKGIAGSKTVRGDLVILIGSPGTEEFGSQFHEWANRWKWAADKGNWKTETLSATSLREPMLPRIRTAFELLNKESDLPVWVVLIGHGTFDGRDAKFAIPGADLDPGQLREMLKTSTRPTAVVLCFSSCAPFLPELSQPDSIILSATNSGNEVSFSYFGKYLSSAIGSPEADLDKDEQTSLLEAFLFAARETANFYESAGRLATEHPLIEDNGDGRPVPPEGFDGLRPVNRDDQAELLPDGLLAHQWHLIPSEADAGLSPEVLAKRNELELAIAKLRSHKTEYTQEQYYTEIKDLLLQMADLLIEDEPESRPPEVPLPEVISVEQAQLNTTSPG
ncbi:MAG: hypothetical protein KDA80_04295 [Planctomycetaceae bacterium]|nr:hypothetical protein [Planctomycetaceae bacterium]